VTMKDTWPEAVRVLASGGSQVAAADAAGVTPQTIHRWLKDEPQFVDALAEARTEVLRQIAGSLSEACAQWVEVLSAGSIDPDIPAQSRIAAASRGLELALKYNTQSYYEQRLRAVEIAAGLRRMSEDLR
jgi:hypothetical protein